MKASLTVATLVVALLPCASIFGTIAIDVVTIGNPGNAPDTRYPDANVTGFGSVSYVHQIDKYEVTAGQYTQFLNAVAKADTNRLYNTAMGVPFLSANIQRIGESPNFAYSVAADWANRPVNFVSFWDAAWFTNWLNNGQPTGMQGPGSTEDGAYHDVGDQMLFGRNADAKFFIPSEDEWYKAAFLDKTAALAATYFDYQTGTDSAPGSDISEKTRTGNNANYGSIYGNRMGVIPDPYFRSDVGEFELSASPYGTFDQGGNVWEWNETVVNSWQRGLRGGAWTSEWDLLIASARGAYDPIAENDVMGFRVASLAIPEPASILLLLAGLVLMSISGRQRDGRDG